MVQFQSNGTLGACPSNGHRSEDRFRSSRLTRSFRAHSRSYVSERIVASCRSEAAAVDGHYSDRLLGRARLKRLLLCGAGWLAACMIQPASAGTNTLTRVGPYGGSVSKVVFHPTNSSIAYA